MFVISRNWVVCNVGYRLLVGLIERSFFLDGGTQKTTPRYSSRTASFPSNTRVEPLVLHVPLWYNARALEFNSRSPGNLDGFSGNLLLARLVDFR